MKIIRALFIILLDLFNLIKINYNFSTSLLSDLVAIKVIKQRNANFLSRNLRDESSNIGRRGKNK